MSYPKANLGAIVLPVPDDEYTLDEYREKYGIDLTEIFDTSSEPVGRKSVSKPLYFYDGFDVLPFNYVEQHDNEMYFGGAIFTTQEGVMSVFSAYGIDFIDATTIAKFEI